ncbi:MAG: protein kinase, partial [Eubacteriales bacterium]|nr:protein kinase [Eubacteriales bacterium]
MDNYIGKSLGGRYEIIDVVGVGGMAVVYRARCHVLNRYVAVKILKDEYAKDPEIRKRFSIESQAVAKLAHQNIVSVYDVGNDHGIDYIVMELIEGITLKEYMQQKGRLTWQEAVFFAEQICRALVHAHSRGVIHQDIKPQNVIILRDGSAKLTDFGIASFATTQETRVVQEAIGSVHYISPEQAKGSKIDYRTDIYSLGVVMYEMLTGKLPFEGETALQVVMQHLNAMPLAPSELVPGIPRGLDAIVMHAMSANIGRRYASAEALYADLERVKNDVTVQFDYPTDDSGETQVIGREVQRAARRAPVQQPPRRP